MEPAVLRRRRHVGQVGHIGAHAAVTRVVLRGVMAAGHPQAPHAACGAGRTRGADRTWEPTTREVQFFFTIFSLHDTFKI